MAADPQLLGPHMPDRFTDDESVAALVDAIDRMVAPVYDLVRDLDDSFVAATAPAGVLRWMGRLLGIDGDDVPALRRAVKDVVDAYRWRGTARGLDLLLRLRYGIVASIEDGGGAEWSEKPNRPIARGSGTVRVLVPAGAEVPGIEAVVRAAIPAHLEFRIERAAAG